MKISRRQQQTAQQPPLRGRRDGQVQRVFFLMSATALAVGSLFSLFGNVHKDVILDKNPAVTMKDPAVTIIQDPHVYDVLIVGSGWSGLGAAEHLHEAGMHNFQVLEARNVVGGRSRTVYPFGHDLAVEMGSAWTYKDTDVHDMLVDNDIPFGRIHYDSFKNVWVVSIWSF
jgi:hypothetical protein